MKDFIILKVSRYEVPYFQLPTRRLRAFWHCQLALLLLITRTLCQTYITTSRTLKMSEQSCLLMQKEGQPPLRKFLSLKSTLLFCPQG